MVMVVLGCRLVLVRYGSREKMVDWLEVLTLQYMRLECR